ncbi:DUF488 domain-containing protein [Soonwooa sp.]|uniref:DUF488 domain-containing protein n=1 Tax=Soonwooa sp. TaxID=1938592 RepID=UPI002601E7C7|nr:DUF488 domain-containing protein [Soonwooa sp.]
MINRKLYTLGYGNLSLKNFIENLQKNEIQVLIDIRTNPKSRWMPEYNRASLSASLQETGIKYGFQGDSLGGKPKDTNLYTNGKLDYLKIRKTLKYQQGLEYLEKGIELGLRIAILCAEQDFRVCHRYTLIGEDLHQRGYEILHLDPKGEPQPHQTELF